DRLDRTRTLGPDDAHDLALEVSEGRLDTRGRRMTFCHGTLCTGTSRRMSRQEFIARRSFFLAADDTIARVRCASFPVSGSGAARAGGAGAIIGASGEGRSIASITRYPRGPFAFSSFKPMASSAPLRDGAGGSALTASPLRGSNRPSETDT